VLVRGIRLGEVERVLLDEVSPRVLGLDVLCGDGSNRFLPFAAARLNGGGIEVDSALTMLDRRQLAHYLERSRSLTQVPGLAEAFVEPGGALVVPLGTRC
jgi:hypothetical protein